MSNAWPHLIDATRIEYMAAKDRSGFLLTVHSQGNPSVRIRLPLSYGSELLTQIENMVRTAEKPFDPNQIRDPKAN